jgi:hypothetical protein
MFDYNCFNSVDLHNILSIIHAIQRIKIHMMNVSMQANNSVDDVILGELMTKKLKEEFCGNNKCFSLSKIYDVYFLFFIFFNFFLSLICYCE